MSSIKIAAAVSLVIILFGIAYGLVALNIGGPPAEKTLRPLGSRYLYYMLNSNETYYTASSPEGVGAILWDYRGLDTLYETMVLFTAIIGAIMIYREYLLEKESRGKNGAVNGLSLIVRAVSKIIIWLTLVIAIALGLTGQLTPGGGFVGGAAFAVMPILVILVFYPWFLRRIGFSSARALMMRTLSLLAIILIIMIPLIPGGYIFQNQVKPGSWFSYPGRFIDSTPLGGIIFWLNTAELFAVAGAFTLAFIILAYHLLMSEGRGQ